MTKHIWTYEEDRYICDLYRDMFIIKTNRFYTYNEMLNKIMAKFPYLNPGSVGMRVSNIKQVLKDLKIKDSLDRGALSNYATLTFMAVKDSLSEIDIAPTSVARETKIEIIQSPKKPGYIKSSSIITIKYLDDDEIIKVSSDKEKAKGDVSYLDVNTPLIQSLLGKYKGDIIDLKIDSNMQLKIEVVEIEE